MNQYKNYNEIRITEFSCSYFKSTISSEKIEYRVYSGGEIDIVSDIKLKEGPYIISHKINSFNDFGIVCMVRQYLLDMGAKDISLFCPYLPYARQDRVEKGKAFTLSCFADLINAMNFANVFTLDVHSNKSIDLINGLVSYMPNEMYRKANKEFNPSLVIGADEGSRERVMAFASMAGIDYLIFKKERSNSVVSYEEVIIDNKLKNNRVLVIDDICDGGATFIELAKKINKYNKFELGLAVTHGIYRHGKIELEKYYKYITNTNSI